MNTPEFPCLGDSCSFAFPSRIEEDLLRIAGQPIPYMRAPAFSALVKECELMLLDLAGNPGGQVIPITASGTAAMEAAVLCYASTLTPIGILNGGGFGQRWGDLCTYHSLDHRIFSAEYACDPDYEALEQFLDREKPAVFLCHHHETASGQLYDVTRIGKLCQERGISLVVDAISSFLADPFDMQEMGIDLALISSQKGLCILPGLSFILLHPRLKGYEFNRTSFYYDFQENLKNLERGQTPYSPATQLFMMLHARLMGIATKGKEQLLNQVTQNAQAFREAISKYGWASNPQTPSSCVTAFFLPQCMDIFHTLYQEGIYIMPGGAPEQLRVAHIGAYKPEDFTWLAQKIYETSKL